MFDSFFEKDAEGVLKALTLEWICPKCGGKNFRLLSRGERTSGAYHGRCRYCRTKCGVSFPPQETNVDGEMEFMDRISEENFTADEKTDMIRDFAEIASLVVDGAPPGAIQTKRKALEEKIAFAKRRRR
jgi:transcription elongation factor Elf1